MTLFLTCLCLSVPRECKHYKGRDITYLVCFYILSGQPMHSLYHLSEGWAEGCGNGEDTRWPGAPWSASCLCWVRGHWAGSQPCPPGSSSLPRQHFMVFYSAQVIVIVLPALKSLGFFESLFLLLGLKDLTANPTIYSFFFFFNGILAFY